MNTCDLMAETHTVSTNDVYISGWSGLNATRDVQIFVRLHTNLCNAPLFMLHGVHLQIKLATGRLSFYLMNRTTDSKKNFKFLDN